MLAALGPLAAATTGAAAWDRLEAIGRAYVAFGAAEPQLFETAFTPCAATDRPDDPAAWDVLVSALDDLAALGEITADRRLADATVAWSSVHGLGTLLSRGLVPAEASEAATQAVLDGVQAALRA